MKTTKETKKKKTSKKKEEVVEEVPVEIVSNDELRGKVRNEKGRFIAGHAKLAGCGMPKGTRYKYSNEIISKISTTLLTEMGSEKFQQGLDELFYEDKRSYFQVLCMMAKISCPTNIDIDVNVKAKTLIDDRLAMLVGKKPKTEDEE